MKFMNEIFLKEILYQRELLLYTPYFFIVYNNDVKEIIVMHKLHDRIIDFSL